jgi:hypothetical protein
VETDLNVQLAKIQEQPTNSPFQRTKDFMGPESLDSLWEGSESGVGGFLLVLFQGT